MDVPMLTIRYYQRPLVVASVSRGPRFESSHWQKIKLNVYCQLFWKDENKEKEAGKGPFKKTNSFVFWFINIPLCSFPDGRTLKVFDFNTWGLNWPFARDRFERFRALREVILQSDFDVALLQEVWFRSVAIFDTKFILLTCAAYCLCNLVTNTVAKWFNF